MAEQSSVSQYRSSMPQPTSFDKEAIKRNAFLDERILVVSIDDPRLPWQDRELLKQIGDRLFRPKPKLVMRNGR